VLDSLVPWSGERAAKEGVHPVLGAVVQNESVPGPTPELLIVLADLEVKREKHGNDWCRRQVSARAGFILDALSHPTSFR
jgi:hypothetical protein